jgi:hypothetical protein
MTEQPGPVVGTILAVALFGGGLAAFAWLSWERFKFREDARRARWEDEHLRK